MARIGNLRSSYALPQTPWQDETPKQDTPPLAEEDGYTPSPLQPKDTPQYGYAPPQGAWTPQSAASPKEQPVPSPSVSADEPPKDVPSGVSDFSSPQSQPRVTAPEGYWQQQLASLPKIGEKKPATADDLIAQWEAEDARKQAEHERSRRAHSALDNIFKGYEAFFNSMAVRKGALSTPSASSQEQQAAQDRFARYQQDRAERKEAYTRKMTKLRQDQEDAHNDAVLKYKLAEAARQKEKDDNMMKLYYDRLEEQKRKAGAQEDLNERKQQHYEDKDAATLDLNERKFSEQQSLNAHRAQALDAQAASAYARAAGGGSSGSSSGKTKRITPAGVTYDMPANMTEGSVKRYYNELYNAYGIKLTEKNALSNTVKRSAQDIDKDLRAAVKADGGKKLEAISKKYKMTRPEKTSSSSRPSIQGRMSRKGNKNTASLDITK